MNRPLKITPIHGGIISARPATSMSASVRGASVIRAKTSARASASSASRGRTAASPICTTWSPRAMGRCCRASTQEALYIVVNAPNERLRFRYLHMLPKQFNADGMVSGRFVHEGEVIGKVGNFFRRERATTYHLHFDMQVPTKYGWVFVNPYMT